MGASASTQPVGTTRDDVFPAGSLRFTSTPAVDAWLASGAPPPRSEASELLRPRAEALIQRLVVKGRDNENLATPSPQRALQAYKARYGADAAAKAFGDEGEYLESCKLPVTVRGTSKRFWWLGDGTPGGDRYFDVRSEDAQEILAVTQSSGAAALAAPGGATGAGGDATRPWEGLELVVSSSSVKGAAPDENQNHWEMWFDSDETPFQDLWDDGNWPADEEPEEWNDFGAPHGAPPPVQRPSEAAQYYRGPRPAGLATTSKMSKARCDTDPTMLAH